MKMKQAWVDFCVRCMGTKADFYSHGNRKIIRGLDHVFTSFGPKDLDLTVESLGYKRQKITLLNGLYFHEESVKIAADLWKYLVERKKYSSACFTTYNHFLKKSGSPKEKRNTRSPCLQSVVLTYVREGKGGVCDIDVFYRSTEIFKKFPADLIFLHETLYNNFDFTDAPIRNVRMHFANISCHPMYLVVILPYLVNPLKTLRWLREQDEVISIESLRFIDRYLNGNQGVHKFRQARAVRDSFVRLMDPTLVKKIHKFAIRETR